MLLLEKSWGILTDKTYLISFEARQQSWIGGNKISGIMWWEATSGHLL